MKSRNYFFNEDIRNLLSNNIANNKAASERAARFISDTEYWLRLDYRELYDLMFSPELKRSWFVLSDGSCPVCRESVPMYNWIHDNVKFPWKMKCPHCSAMFPSNDFEAYYKSGLDDSGRFSHERADRTLLVSSDGGFVIDDGNGWYDKDGRRYMFIGAWLAHSLWDLGIVSGVSRLAFSYVLTGNGDYAVRAALLLHSISRFWPEFDFYTQGIMYEQEFKSKGYVAYWVNSNRDVRMLAMAYDQIFDYIKDHGEFEEVLGISSLNLCQDIEERIFRDSLRNVDKIHTNPPWTPITVAILRTVLDYDTCKKEILGALDELIEEATRIDGMTGESGLSGYAAIGPRALADLLCLYSNIDDSLMYEIFRRNPVLYNTYRFHIDTWYNTTYYPGIGDSSIFAYTARLYAGLFSSFTSQFSLMFKSYEWFAMELARFYNEPDFARALYHSKSGVIEGAFNDDIYIGNPGSEESELRNLLDSNGYTIKWKSVNYNKWRLSVLHTGSDRNKTMLAMPYSSGANHCHHDALSLHLFSKGLNILADFGYPPVNYGGWETKEANWYKQPAAHNTVVIDKKMHTNIPPHGDGMFYRYPAYGNNIFFIDHDFIHATYNDAREYADAARFERFSILVDVSDSDCYCLDIFRVSGGTTHARFQRSTYSNLEHPGLILAPGKEYDSEKTIMRNFMTDSCPAEGWFADFNLDDVHNVLDVPRDLHLRYHPHTPGTSVTICESWVDITKMSQIDGEKTGNREIWIPTLIEETVGGKSQFTGILETYDSRPFIESSKRLKFTSQGDFGEVIVIRHSEGIEDIIILNDPESKGVIDVEAPEISTDALFAIIRLKNKKMSASIIKDGAYMRCNKRLIKKGQEDNIIFI
ncbi:MAG TPA: heparinase II/III family protein [Clostridia bacterium]|nr:heparinase II/III family protein [Clostridia bacterium]